MRFERWGRGEEVSRGSRHWAYRLKAWCWQLELTVYCHTTQNPRSSCGDRWVFQPALIWDRRP